MELRIDEKKRELKSHGTYGFPVNLTRKKLSSYATGAFPWHWHDEIELTFILSGEMEYRVNDAHYLLKAGEGLFCNSDALHAGSMAGDGDCDYVSLTFHPRFLCGFEGSVIGEKYVDGIVNNPSLSSVHLDPDTPWQKEALGLLPGIYRSFRDKPEMYELEMQRLLLAFWSRLYGNYADEVKRAPVEDPEKIERLRSILSYLNDNYREKITLEEVARQAKLCKSECCRFFKRQMGVSLFDYLLDYRIGRSLSLLKAGHTVAQSAVETGFTSPAYFAKVFRARTGRSPSEYRKDEVKAKSETEK